MSPDIRFDFSIPEESIIDQYKWPEHAIIYEGVDPKSLPSVAWPRLSEDRTRPVPNDVEKFLKGRYGDNTEIHLTGNNGGDESPRNKAPLYNVGIRNPNNRQDYRPLAHMEATEVNIWFTKGLHESLRDQVGKKMLTWQISESTVANKIREQLAKQAESE